MNVKLIERGWAGHFICSDRCVFHRNTLVDGGHVKIVVSTVGAMVDIHARGWPNKLTFDEIGLDRYYETMCFKADMTDTRYYDADVSQHISLNGKWCIDHLDADDEANNMHDDAVAEIKARMEAGEFNVPMPSHV